MRINQQQERNRSTKQELTRLYEELQVLEDEQDEYHRHIRELHQIGIEYPLRIRDGGLSLPNDHILYPTVSIAVENEMAANLLLAELERSFQPQQMEQFAEPDQRQPSAQETKPVAPNLRTTKCKTEHTAIGIESLFILNNFSLLFVLNSLWQAGSLFVLLSVQRHRRILQKPKLSIQARALRW